MKGLNHAPLLTPEAKWEGKGLQMEEVILEPDGELYVSVPIQNPTHEPVRYPLGI